ncbi:MAG: hypothetical protein GXY74_14650 [Phycisphaerae bacterium]|nr:hypothetical protein [Phycisphaerae bacterium]
MDRALRAGLVVVLTSLTAAAAWQFGGESSSAAEAAGGKAGVPKLIDLGSTECIPCKLMAPALDEMRKQFSGKLAVEFIDVANRENAALVRQYNLRLIPTQVFLDTEGKELCRHEGFISRYGILDKFRELGYAFAAEALKPAFSRLEPAGADGRDRERVCWFCDGDIDAKTAVVVKTDKGDVTLCSPHCWFIMYSCLTQDKTGFDAKASVADWATGQLVPATAAIYLYGLEEKSGRPTIKAFADRATAEAERKAAGGSLVGYEVLRQKELAPRCGFCDRAVYAEDAALVKIDGVHSWGCCSHCAMGVAARTGKNIEVHQKDRLTGEMIVVKTLGGYIQSVEPPTAVAWFGKKKTADGSYISAGCFHQGFFASLENLKKWAEENPAEIGSAITIDQALGDKMRMSPAQIAKACKMGQCAPK